MKSCFAIAVIMIAGALSASCGGTNDVAIKGYHLTFPLPDGWTVTQNDATTNRNGALCVLMKQGTGQGHQPAICIWLGRYADELGQKFGMTPGDIMVLMPAAGQKPMGTGKVEASLDWSQIMNQKTKHTFAEFTVSGSDVRAAVAALDRENKSGTFFSISVAAARDSFDVARDVADKLVTHILAQLNASPAKQDKK